MGRPTTDVPEVQSGIPKRIQPNLSNADKIAYFNKALRRMEPVTSTTAANHHWREERAVLGLDLFRQLQRARNELRQIVLRANQAHAGVGHLTPEQMNRHISDDELASLMLHQSGLESDVADAAKNVNPQIAPFLNFFPESSKVLHGEHVNPYAAGGLIPLEIGGLFLGPLKGARGAFEGIRAIAAGKSATEAGRAAAEAYNVSTPIRTATAGALKVIRPGSRSRTGRFLETFADNVRPRLSKATGGVVKDEKAIAGEEFGRQQASERRLKELPAQELKRLGKKLSPEEQYAIRLVLEGTLPEDRAAAHTAWAQHSEAPDLHLLHAYMAKKAGQFIEMGANGAPQLRVTAPKILKRALEKAQEVSQGRDDLIREMGALSDRSLMERIQAPGRVIHGAEWKTIERQLEDALAASPLQDQIRQSLNAAGVDDNVANAEVSLFERMVRHAAEANKDNPQQIQEILNYLKGVQYQDVLPQNLPLDTIFQTAAKPVEELHSYYTSVARDLAKLPGKPFTAKSPKRLAGVLDGVRQRAIEAAMYRHWYTESARGILEHVGGDKVEAAKLAKLLAIYSPRARVWDESTWNNVTRAMGAYDEFQRTGEVSARWSLSKPGAAHRQAVEHARATGQPEPPHRDWQTEAANAAMKGGPQWSGLKTNRFYRNFLEDIDPAAYAREFGNEPHVTIDTWMRRAFGYPRTGAKKNESITDEMYTFMSDATTAIAKELGWAPKEVQAAVWTSIKAEMEGTPLNEAGFSFADALKAYKSRGSQEQLFQAAMPEPQPSDPVEAGVLDTLHGSGGHTWNADLTPSTAKEGFAVSLKGAETPVPAEQFTADTVRQFRDAHSDLFANDADLKVGAWNDNGTVYLDVSKIVPSYGAAMNLGRQEGQRAVFDIGKGEVLNVTEPSFPAASSEALTPGERPPAPGPDLSTPGADYLRGKGLLFQSGDGETFGEAARRSLEEYAAMARDVARTLPEDEWPAWVRNQIRRQAERGAEEITSTYGQAHDILSEAVSKGFDPNDPFTKEGGRLLGNVADQIEALRGQVPDHLIEALDKYAGEGDYDSLAAVARAVGDHADNGPLMDSITKLIAHGPERPDWLGQNPLQMATGYRDRIRGATEFAPEQAIIHLTMHADESTFPHELAHVARRYWLSPKEEANVAKWAGAKRLEDGTYEWSVEAEEKFARGFEEFLRRGIGPAGAKPEFATISKALNEVYRNGMLPDVPRKVAEQLTKLFEHKRYPNVGNFVGAEDFNLGVARVPYLRGVPMPHDAKMAAAYMRAVFNRGKIMGEPRDQAMLHQFKAGLLKSGYFQFKTAEPTAESLISAVRLFAAHRARPALLEAAKTADGEFRRIPESAADIPIKIDPSKPIGKQSPTEGVTRLHELMQQAEESGVAITPDDLEGAGGYEMVEAAREDMLPTLLDGRHAHQVAEDFLKGRIEEPIDNIAWIPANFMDNARLLPEAYKPAAKGAKRVLGSAGKIGLDVVNDVQRALVLYLNPVYIPVNLIGNLAMNVMQQGVFLPANIYRAALLYRELSHEERNMMDTLLGHGLIQSSAGSASLRPIKKVTDPMAHYIGNLVDLQPRRLAFIHEARREGIGLKEMKELLRSDSKEMTVKRQLIRQRANDAIVDYERLSPFERNYLTRTLFFYPWLKGATRWTERWALDHPIQALVLASAGDYAWSAAQQQLGERPEYAQFDMPISTKTVGLSLPGVGDVGLDQAVGEHTLTNAQGLPEVMNVRQLFTQTTPIELAQAGLSFVSGGKIGGKKFPALVESLTPGLYAGGVSLFGFDPFMGKEVPQGAGSFFHTLFSPDAIPAYSRYKAITRSSQEQQNFEGRSLHPRSRGEEVARTFLGGIANAPYNPKVGAELILDTKSAYDRHLHDWTTQAQDVGMRPPNDVETRELRDYLQFHSNVRKHAKGSDGNLDYDLAAKIAVDEWERLRPGDGRARAAYEHARTVGQKKNVYDLIGHALFEHYLAYDRNLSHRVDARLYSSASG